MRDVVIKRRADTFIPGAPTNFNNPIVIASGNAGGKWYGFFHESNAGFQPKYRHLLIDGVQGPLSIYQLDVEGGRGEAMAEINNSKNINIFGIKSEGEYPLLWVRNSDFINLYGRAGNATPLGFAFSYPDGYTQMIPSSFRIENTPNFRMASMMDRLDMGCDGNPPYTIPNCGSAPDQFYILLENTSSGQTIVSPALDRPILYKRGK